VVNLPALSELSRQHELPDVASQYIDLQRTGSEYEALCPFHADRNPSLRIYRRASDASWRFKCFACGAHGDTVDFVREIEGVDTAEAARRLRGDGPPPVRIERPAPVADAELWAPVVPVPRDTPPPFDPARAGNWLVWNPKRGREWSFRPAASWAYTDAEGRLLGWVARIEFDDGKITPAVTWCRNTETGAERWCMRPFPTPRPLLGLQDLAARSEAPVLVVSGEKCHAVAARLLPSSVAITWPGGDNGESSVDWSPLAGRRVTLWMDADVSGAAAGDRIARRLQALGCAVRSLDTEAQPKGWDIADAVADGWDRARVVAFARDRVRTWVPKDEAPASVPSGEGSDAVQLDPQPMGGTTVATYTAAPDEGETPDVREYMPALDADATPEPPPALTGELVTDDMPAATASAITVCWKTYDLTETESGTPHANIDNVTRLLTRHPDFAGRLWYDEFDQRVWSTWGRDEPFEWSDYDSSRLTLWLQRAVGLRTMKTATVQETVDVVARMYTRHAAREWLESLQWDGSPRLSTWISRAFGTDQDEYHASVGRCWLISMVRRVLDPGCKVDTMPVFEGAQGIRKSTAMETLVGKRWFAEAQESPTSKDFHLTLVGKILVEIAEMNSFSRADVEKIKQVISCRVDRYRKPYGRRSEDHPRSCVFAGTVNRDDWNRDETGARRFWPIACTIADADWLARNREQLWAEAVALAAAGVPHWDVPEDAAKAHQEARRASDEWETLIADYLVGRFEVRATDVLTECLGVHSDRQGKAEQMRVAKALTVLGWRRVLARRGSNVLRVWVKAGELPL
jgi:predicted P-loop ATPase